MPNGDWEKRDEGMRKRRDKVKNDINLNIFIVVLNNIKNSLPV
jgi:hypothetical protein